MVRAGPACAEDIGDAALVGGLLAGLFRNLRSRLSNFDQPSRSTALVVLDSGAEEDSPIDGGSSRAISSCAPRTASSARDESSSACRWPCIKLDAGPWASAAARRMPPLSSPRVVSAASEKCSRSSPISASSVPVPVPSVVAPAAAPLAPAALPASACALLQYLLPSFRRRTQRLVRPLGAAAAGACASSFEPDWSAPALPAACGRRLRGPAGAAAMRAARRSITARRRAPRRGLPSPKMRHCGSAPTIQRRAGQRARRW